MTRNEKIAEYIKSITGFKLKSDAIKEIIRISDEYDKQEAYAVLYTYVDSQEAWNTRPIRKTSTTYVEIMRQKMLWNGGNSKTYRWDCYDEDGNLVTQIYSVNPILF